MQRLTTLFLIGAGLLALAGCASQSHPSEYSTPQKGSNMAPEQQDQQDRDWLDESGRTY